MPYIRQDDRAELDKGLRLIAIVLFRTPLKDMSGTLNYIIFKLMLTAWVYDRSYSLAASLLSALTEAAAEFRVRWLRKYEDKKIQLNGDIEPFSLNELKRAQAEEDNSK